MQKVDWGVSTATPATWPAEHVVRKAQSFDRRSKMARPGHQRWTAGGRLASRAGGPFYGPGDNFVSFTLCGLLP